MTFYPLPGKGEQEMQEENNDNYKVSPPSHLSLLIIVWVGLCRDHPCFTKEQAEVSPLL